MEASQRSGYHHLCSLILNGGIPLVLTELPFKHGIHTSMAKAMGSAELSEVYPINSLTGWCHKREGFLPRLSKGQFHAIRSRFPFARVILGCPSKASYASLLCGVLHIILLCTKKKMIWADTTRNIASVAHKERFIKDSIGNFVGEPMSSNTLITLPAQKKSPIVVSRQATSPKPARLSLFHFFPKSLLNGPTLKNHYLFSCIDTYHPYTT